jgi:site-specific DNA-methyltransferase (adenine-specific)
VEKDNIRNKVFNGDCLEIMKTFPDFSIDMILTDLPYGVTNNKWDSVIPFEPMWESFWRVLKPTGIIALTSSQPFTSALIMSQVKYFKHEWIWIKNRGSNFANTVREPMKEHESVLIFSKGKWTYNKQMQERTGGGASRVNYAFNLDTKSENYRDFEGRKKDKGTKLRVPSSWQKFNVEVGLHPTQKPTKLFEYLIKTYTNENELVLDCCAGSGTTGEACKNLNRDYVLIEKEQKYYNTILERLGIEDDFWK